MTVPDLVTHDVRSAIADVGVVPVVTLTDPATAVPVTEALVAGGLRVVEITLRTAAGLEAIARASAVEGAVVGAGTVTSADLAHRAGDAGARFLVAPGLDDGMVDAALARGVLPLPGVATPTELMRAMALGLTTVKLFPAGQLGGLGMVSALAAVAPGVRFVPTGGIGAADVGAYLASPSVLAVGGTWITPAAVVDAGDWARITDVARAASDAVAAAR